MRFKQNAEGYWMPAEETQAPAEVGEKKLMVEFEAMTVDELKKYAAENDIDISGAKLKAEIMEVLQKQKETEQEGGE